MGTLTHDITHRRSTFYWTAFVAINARKCVQFFLYPASFRPPPSGPTISGEDLEFLSKVNRGAASRRPECREATVRKLNRAALAGYGSHHRPKVFDARQLPPARLVDVRFAAEKRRLGRLAHGWAGRKLRPARERLCDEVITRAIGIPQRQEQAAGKFPKWGMTDAVVVDSFAYAVRAGRQRASAR